jgi:hypothetical protein
VLLFFLSSHTSIWCSNHNFIHTISFSRMVTSSFQR